MPLSEPRLAAADEQFNAVFEHTPFEGPVKIGTGLKLWERSRGFEFPDGNQIGVLEIFRKRSLPAHILLGPLRQHTLRAVEFRSAVNTLVSRYIWFPGETGLMVTSDMEMLREKPEGFTTFDLFREQAQGLTEPQTNDWEKLNTITQRLVEAVPMNGNEEK